MVLEQINQFLRKSGHNPRPFKNGEPSFQIISRNIDILKPYGQPISVEVTYTKKHLTLGISPSDLQDYFEKRFGITNVIVVPVISKNDSLSLSQTIATSLQFERIRDVNRISENIYIDERIKFIRRLQIFTHQILSTSPSKLFCDFGVSNFTITTKGDIYPCQLLVGLNKFKIENVFSDFDKIHYALRKSIRKYRKISEKAQYKKCADCYLQFYCTGCPAGEYILNRKFISPSMFDACDMRKEVIKETLIAYAINVLSDKTI
ncbi:MAG: SPASM domain-containing protein [candidate division WOR-3 bacterium]